MKKKILSAFLTVVMVFGLLPAVSVNVGANRSGDWTYEVFTISGEQFARITQYHGNGGNVVMPSSLDSFAVREFTASVFVGNTTLTDITISEGVTTIPTSRFQVGAFRGCRNLRVVTLPRTLTHIDTDAFRDTDALRTVTIPDSVTHIGSGAFSNTGLGGLTEITFKGQTPPSLRGYALSGTLPFSGLSVQRMYVPIGTASVYRAHNFGFTGHETIEVCFGANCGTCATCDPCGNNDHDFPEGCETTCRYSACNVKSTKKCGTCATCDPCRNNNHDFLSGCETTCRRSACNVKSAKCGTCAVCKPTTTTPPATTNPGRILPGDNRNVTIGDALEILKYLAGMQSSVNPANPTAWNAALITSASRSANRPSIADALEILKKLAGMSSLLT